MSGVSASVDVFTGTGVVTAAFDTVGSPTGSSVGLSPWTPFNWSWFGGAFSASRGGGASTGPGFDLYRLPKLQGDSGGAYKVYAGGGSTTFVPPVSGTGAYVGTAGSRLILAVSGSGFLVTYPDGATTSFNTAGTFTGSRDAWGNETAATLADAYTVESVSRYAGTVSSGTELERVAFSYDGYDRLSELDYFRRAQGGGALAAYAGYDIGYYGLSETNGMAGDVRTITLQIGGQDVATDYFRYNVTEAGGTLQHHLKGVYDARAVARGIADSVLTGTGAAWDTVSDASLAPYLSLGLTYGTFLGSVAVASVTRAGAGAYEAGVTGDGRGTTTYSYQDVTGTYLGNSTELAITLSTKTTPDGSVLRTYADRSTNRVILDDRWGSDAQTGSAGRDWVTAYTYDTSGRLAATYSPSATGVGTSAPSDTLELLSHAGRSYFLRDSVGRVDTVGYVDAGTGGPNAVATVGVRQGRLGTDVKLTDYTYGVHAAASGTSTYLASVTDYTATNATGGRTTAYGYTFGTGPGPTRIDTTPPTVSTNTHGSGQSVTYTAVLDAFGRPAWSRDPLGAVTYTVFDDSSNAVVKSIADADLTKTNDFTGTAIPSGWTNTGSGTPAHLVTLADADRLGRVTKLVPPRYSGLSGSARIVSHTVYNDAAHEMRAYGGWADTTTAASGLAPVAVYREDWGRGYAESITLSGGSPATSAGKPTGAEVITGYTVESLSRARINLAGQAYQSDQYVDLGTLSYSASSVGLGTAGVNYHATKVAFDAVGRAYRVTLPTGTITQTAYDLAGRPAGTLVGTTTSNLRLVSDVQYDGGGVGDSLPTVSRQFTEFNTSTGAPVLTTARVTVSAYDWRGRTVWIKQGAHPSQTSTDPAAFALDPAGEVDSSTSTWAGLNGYNRPLTYFEYDNLGQLLTIDRFDGRTITFTGTSTPASLSLDARRVGRTAYAYDALGRTYESKEFSVGPTGAYSGTVALTGGWWYDAAGRLSATVTPNAPGAMYAYDRAGRLTGTYAVLPSEVTTGVGLSNATVYEQTEYLYDRDGHALRATVRQRDHDAASTAKGALRAEGGAGNRGYFYRWSYDAVGRLTASVNLGTRYYDVLKGDFGGGVASDNSSNAPNGSFDIGDANAFLLALSSPSAYAALNPSATLGEVLARGDFGGDESLDGSYNTPETSFDELDSEGFFLAMSDPSRYAEIQPVPQRGGDALVTSYAYDPAGRLSFVTDPRGIANSYVYDLAGRTTKTVENNTTTNALGGTLTATANRLTSYKYDAMGRVTEMTATNVSGGQTTGFSYTPPDPTTSYSGVFSNESLRGISHTAYTDDYVGPAVRLTEIFDVNALGERVAKTDRNGTGHLYTYDALGRLRADRVTNAATWSGGGVDRTVLALRYDYDAAGRLAKAVSVKGIGTNLATPTLDQTLAAGNAANAVTFTYDGLGNLTKDIQDVIVGGTVTPTGSVAYTWSAPSASVNSSLLTGMAYKAESLTYAYDALSRVTSMSGKAVGAPSAGQVDIEAYDYLGLSTVVRVLRAEQAGAGGSLTYVAVGSEGTNTWAGDAYNGLDRFGRVADRRWVLGSTASGADADRLKYGYDAGSNPLYKLNTLSSAHSEAFTYDGLGRLATFDRGSIAFSGSGVATVASPTRSQDWTLDTLGNWDSLSTDGGTPVSRTHDRQNRLTTLAGQSLTYDSNGNQLTDEAGNVLVYDAWDRNVGWYNPDTSGYIDEVYVFDEDGNPTVSNPYDALGRRVSRRWTTTDWLMETTQTDTAYLSAPDGRRLWERTVWSGTYVVETVDAGPDVAGYTYVYAATDPNRLAARDTFDRTTVGNPLTNSHNGPTFLAERAYVRGDLVGNTTSTAVITSDGTNASVGSTERYAVDPYGDGVVVMDGSFTPKSGNASDRGWNNFFQTGFTDPASGLIHFGAREYDPSQGRWLQQDPAGWPDGSNRYEAMGSAPTRYTDPTGLVFGGGGGPVNDLVARRSDFAGVDTRPHILPFFPADYDPNQPTAVNLFAGNPLDPSLPVWRPDSFRLTSLMPWLGQIGRDQLTGLPLDRLRAELDRAWNIYAFVYALAHGLLGRYHERLQGGLSREDVRAIVFAEYLAEYISYGEFDYWADAWADYIDELNNRIDELTKGKQGFLAWLASQGAFASYGGPSGSSVSASGWKAPGEATFVINRPIPVTLINGLMAAMGSTMDSPGYPLNDHLPNQVAVARADAALFVLDGVPAMAQGNSITIVATSDGRWYAVGPGGYILSKNEALTILQWWGILKPKP